MKLCEKWQLSKAYFISESNILFSYILLLSKEKFKSQGPAQQREINS